MSIVIIKYNAGNVQSVLHALNRIGSEAVLSDDHDVIRQADKVIFPGVGEASSAMNYLRERKLDKLITELNQPVLGICLGMQLMCTHSEENNTTCMGIFPAQVNRFKNPAGEKTFKIPQVGWNKIYNLKGPLFTAVDENSYVYLVHSYYAAHSEHTTATANYIQPYSVALTKKNYFGVQFHPEKSAATGEKILKNFLSL